MADVSAISRESLITQEPTQAAKRFNYIRELRALVAEVLTTYDQIAEKERTSAEWTKREFKNVSGDHASLIGESGRVNRNIKIVSLLLSMGTLGLFQNADDREIGRMLSSQLVPAFGDMRTSGIQSSMQKASMREQLALADINKVSQQSNTNAKEGALETLKALDRLGEGASRAN